MQHHRPIAFSILASLLFSLYILLLSYTTLIDARALHIGQLPPLLPDPPRTWQSSRILVERVCLDLSILWASGCLIGFFFTTSVWRRLVIYFINQHEMEVILPLLHQRLLPPPPPSIYEDTLSQQPNSPYFKLNGDPPLFEERPSQILPSPSSKQEHLSTLLPGFPTLPNPAFSPKIQALGPTAIDAAADTGMHRNSGWRRRECAFMSLDEREVENVFREFEERELSSCRRIAKLQQLGEAVEGTVVYSDDALGTTIGTSYNDYTPGTFTTAFTHYEMTPINNLTEMTRYRWILRLAPVACGFGLTAFEVCIKIATLAIAPPLWPVAIALSGCDVLLVEPVTWLFRERSRDTFSGYRWGVMTLVSAVLAGYVAIAYGILCGGRGGDRLERGILVWGSAAAVCMTISALSWRLCMKHNVPDVKKTRAVSYIQGLGAIMALAVYSILHVTSHVGANTEERFSHTRLLVTTIAVPIGAELLRGCSVQMVGPAAVTASMPPPKSPFLDRLNSAAAAFTSPPLTPDPLTPPFTPLVTPLGFHPLTFVVLVGLCFGGFGISISQYMIGMGVISICVARVALSAVKLSRLASRDMSTPASDSKQYPPQGLLTAEYDGGKRDVEFEGYSRRDSVVYE